MATLPLVSLNPDTWIEISGDMVSGTSYSLSSGGAPDFMVVEKATAPVDADSRFRVGGNDILSITYEGVPFWCKSITINSEAHIQEAP